MADSMLDNQINRPIPDWKIKLSYFYVKHKIVLKRALVFFIFFFDVVIVFLLGGILLNYQTGLIADENHLISLPYDLVNYSVIHDLNQPDELRISPVEIITSGSGNYDIFAVITNSNRKWAVPNIVYAFVVDGVKLEPKTSFILPASAKYLIQFNLNNVHQASLKIINVDWKRIEDYSLLSYQNSIEISRAVFETVRSGAWAGRAKFTIFNNSPYSFWEVGLPIILRDRGSNAAGVNYITINKLLSKEEREIDIGWPYEVLGSVSTIDITPEVNLLDDRVIMKITAPPGSPPGLE